MATLSLLYGWNVTDLLFIVPQLLSRSLKKLITVTAMAIAQTSLSTMMIRFSKNCGALHIPLYYSKHICQRTGSKLSGTIA